jgi:hypothetical protein
MIVNRIYFVLFILTISLIIILSINSSQPKLEAKDEIALIYNQFFAYNETKNIYLFLGSSQNYIKIEENYFSNQGNQAKWLIILIEPNDFYSNNLFQLKSKLDKYNNYILIYESSISWLYDGEIDFYVNKSNKSFGSINPSFKLDSKFESKKIKSIDIHNILKTFSFEDKVTVEIELNGAEYFIIQYLIRNESIKLIDNIKASFSTNASSIFYKSDDVFRSLFEAYGIKSLFWH